MASFAALMATGPTGENGDVWLTNIKLDSKLKNLYRLAEFLEPLHLRGLPLRY
jgi:hypothetical protein